MIYLSILSCQHCRYYGQNSYGATHGSDTANWQKDLSYYCQVFHRQL